MRMDVNNNPDIEFPGGTVTVSQPGAAPTELETQVTQRVEAAIRAINGVDEIKSTVREGSSQHLRPVRASARRSTAPSTTSATPSPRSAATFPTASSSRRSRASTSTATPIAYFAVESTDMTLEELSWYIDNTVAKRLLAGRPAWPRSTAAAESAARSGSSSIRSRCRRTASPPPRSTPSSGRPTSTPPAAAPRSPAPSSRSGCSAMRRDAYRPRRDPDRGRRRPHDQARRHRRGPRPLCRAALARDDERPAGAELLAFQRAKGASDVTVFDGAEEELEKLEEENPARSSSASCSPASNIPKAQYQARWRRWSRARCSRCSSSSSSCATGARP